MVCPHKQKRAALCNLYKFTVLINQSHPRTVKHSAHIKLSYSTGTFSKIIFLYQRSHLHQHFLIAVSVYSGYAFSKHVDCAEVSLDRKLLITVRNL